MNDVVERLKEFEVYHYLRGPKQERLIYDAIAEIERLRGLLGDVLVETVDASAYCDGPNIDGDLRTQIREAMKAWQAKYASHVNSTWSENRADALMDDAIAEIERLMETNRLISLDIHKAWEALEQIAYNDTARRPGDREDLIETAAEALEGK